MVFMARQQCTHGCFPSFVRASAPQVLLCCLRSLRTCLCHAGSPGGQERPLLAPSPSPPHGGLPGLPTLGTTNLSVTEHGRLHPLQESRSPQECAQRPQGPRWRRGWPGAHCQWLRWVLGITSAPKQTQFNSFNRSSHIC